MRIAICDDDALCREEALAAINEFLARSGHTAAVEVFSHSDDVIDAVEKRGGFDLYILDVVMPHTDGIALGEALRGLGCDGKIIYLTSSDEFALHSYRVKAFDYLLKPINVDELQATLKRIEVAFLAANKDIIPSSSEDNYKPEEIVSLVKEYVQNHYANDISLTTLSDKFGFSSSYLTKIFTKIEGTTPSKYIRDYRMGIAKQLLQEPGASINTVSAAVGYPDPFHFSKSFKQTFGISPSEYRTTL